MSNFPGQPLVGVWLWMRAPSGAPDARTVRGKASEKGRQGRVMETLAHETSACGPREKNRPTRGPRRCPGRPYNHPGGEPTSRPPTTGGKRMRTNRWLVLG